MKFLFLLLISVPLVASAPYGVLVDPDLSPFSGAETLLLANKIPSRYVPRPQDYTISKKVLRALELCLIWDPLSQVCMLAQHEIFGHGYRIRSLGSQFAVVAGYSIAAPIPYGPGSGATNYFPQEALTTMQKSTISSGGVEATAIMAGELKKKWLIDGCIDGRMAALYNYTEHDLTFYILTMGSAVPSPSSNDMLSYLYWLNTTYPQASLSKNNLRQDALVNFLDPMTYYAIYAWFKYIDSAQSAKVPMIEVGPVRWLPNLRLGLTPFGPETFMENYLIWRRQVIYCYFKGGSFAGNTFWGVGIENKTWFRKDRLMFGIRFDGWSQPPYSPFLVQNALAGLSSPTLTGDQSPGISLIGTLYWLVDPASLFVAFGYKSRGFLPGESLSATPILRVGLFRNL